MLGLVGKGDDLSLYRRTISRSNGLYLSVIKRRIRQSAAKNLMRLFISVENVARELTQFTAALGKIAKVVKINVAGLLRSQ